MEIVNYNCYFQSGTRQCRTTHYVPALVSFSLIVISSATGFSMILVWGKFPIKILQTYNKVRIWVLSFDWTLQVSFKASMKYSMISLFLHWTINFMTLRKKNLLCCMFIKIIQIYNCFTGIVHLEMTLIIYVYIISLVVVIFHLILSLQYQFYNDTLTRKYSTV